MTQPEQTPTDPMTDLVLRVQDDHMLIAAGVEHPNSPEHHRCRCGQSYSGKGALSSGRRHVAAEVVAALEGVRIKEVA